MSYTLVWKNPAIDPGKVDIVVPVATTVAGLADIIFTGKGSANHGKIQQENLMRVLENFAGPTPPDYPTVGQTWYDSATTSLKVFTSSVPPTWTSLSGVQVRLEVDGPPPTAKLGDLWFEVTGDASGILYLYTGVGRFPYSLTTIGGWEQVWPKVDTFGLREEFDQIKQQLDILGFDQTVDRVFTNFPDFTALDADLAAKLALTPDSNVNHPYSVEAPKVQPVSYDWDELLSAARWHVERLDVPATTWQDISSSPFVQDGRQLRDHFFDSFALTDPRSPDPRRSSSNPQGSISMHRLYAETVNVLNAVEPFAFTLRGMAGASGTTSDFAPDVVSWTHAIREGAWLGGGSLTATTIFRWASSGLYERFIASGSALEITVELIGGAGAGASGVNALLASVGRVRITADQLRWMDSSAIPVMQVAPEPQGLSSLIASNTTLGTRTHPSGAVLSIAGAIPSTTTLSLTATASIGLALTGQLRISFAVIHDTTNNPTSPTEANLYPIFNLYNPVTDATGTSPALANVPVVDRPVADFTANGNTGAAQFTVAAGNTVTFVSTSTGASTFEWDYQGTGTFVVGAATEIITFATPGVYSPRLRVTNAAGANVMYRPGMIKVI